MPSLARVTKELLKSYNRFPRKRLGQHFLIDPQVLLRIMAAAKIGHADHIVEIGSGLGVVTAELAKKAEQVTAVEIDQELITISKELLSPFKNITFIAKDILKVELQELVNQSRYKVIGNLPYYITAPIIEKIIEANNKPELAVLMVQREVAERMAALPGTKKYGSFSIFVQYHAEVILNSLVSKSSFLPWPKVGSAIVVLKPYRNSKYAVKDEKLFFDIVHAAFQQRRKKLKNSLGGFALDGTAIDLGRRPETLALEDFVSLANYLVENAGPSAL
jgi:16S rRNA (adenine1518-N6/adenine1519-N6)-dimethyltransferase